MPSIELRASSNTFQCSNPAIQPHIAFQNLGRWTNERITKVAHVTSHFFTNLQHACYQCTLVPLQNLGRWLDGLIIKVYRITSRYFSILAHFCYHYITTSFHNLGKWLQNQIDRIASCFSCFSTRPPPPVQPPPPAKPRTPRRRRNGQKRLTPIERLARDWPQLAAESAAARAANMTEEQRLLELVAEVRNAGQESSLVRQESATDILARELREGMQAGGFDFGSFHTAPILRRHKPHVHFGRSTSKSALHTANLTAIFCSKEHRAWYETNKSNLPISVGLLHLLQFDEGEDEAEEHMQRIHEYIRLRYFVFLLTQTDRDQFEVHRLFRSLTPQRQRALIQAVAPEVHEWDGHTIPQGMWTNPDLIETLREALSALNLD